MKFDGENKWEEEEEDDFIWDEDYDDGDWEHFSRAQEDDDDDDDVYQLLRPYDEDDMEYWQDQDNLSYDMHFESEFDYHEYLLPAATLGAEERQTFGYWNFYTSFDLANISFYQNSKEDDYEYALLNFSETSYINGYSGRCKNY